MEKNTWIWILFIGAILLLLGGFGAGGSMMGFGMGFGAIFMALFWIALIWLIVALITSRQSKENPDAMGILQKRYAKGEISKKEFDKMKEDIG